MGARCGSLEAGCESLEARCGSLDTLFTRVFMQQRFLKFRSIFVIVFQRSVVMMVYYATGHRDYITIILNKMQRVPTPTPLSQLNSEKDMQKVTYISNINIENRELIFPYCVT